MATQPKAKASDVDEELPTGPQEPIVAEEPEPETAREILEVLSAITRSITESSRSATPGEVLSTTVVVGS